MESKFMERYGKIEDLDRSFDVSFWQSQSADARFKATWDLIVHASSIRGINVRQLRLHRTVESFQTQRR